MKMIGIGMLVALLLDASIVRVLLVPATMHLLGHLNWWAPKSMRDWWRNNSLGTGEVANDPPPRTDDS